MMVLVLMGVALVSLHPVYAESCIDKSLVTFNVGLTPRVRDYETRRSVIPEAIREHKFDVMCIQEAWYEDDMAAIIEAVKGDYPYSWSELHHTTTNLGDPDTGFFAWFRSLFTRLTSTPCSLGELISVGICFATKCSQVQGDATLSCIVDHCADALFGISQSCLTCVTLSSNSMMSRCLGTTRVDNRFNTRGLMILSKTEILPLPSQQYIPDIKQFAPRGYIRALVTGLGHAVCTHFTANIAEYNGSFPDVELTKALGITSWKEQQKREIQTLTSRFPYRHFLLGDMNNGPDVPSTGVDGEFPENYLELVNSGYRNPYVEGGPALCTFCSSNPLVSDAYDRRYILDHVMLKGFPAGVARGVKRVLETNSKGVALSDHYGVQLDICI